MKVKFKPVFRGLMLFLLLAVACSLWAATGPGTNAPARPSPLLTAVEQLQGEHLTFGLDRIEPLQRYHLLGEPLWKYVASLIYILLAFYVAKLLDWIANAWLKRLARRKQSGTSILDLLLEWFHGPVKVVVFVLLLNIGLSIFDWPEHLKMYLSRGLILVAAASLTYLCLKVIYLLLDVWRARTAHEPGGRFNDQLFSVLRKSLAGFVIVVAVLVTAQNIGINITAAITSLSIGGLAVGLAAQDTLANLFGAVSIFADKPFQVGDQIKLDAGEGSVEEVGLRSTRLRSPDGYLVAIPNKTMGNSAITNLTRRETIRTVMNIELASGQPTGIIKRALQILERVYREHPMTQDAWISFNQFAGAKINILVTHWWKGTDYPKYLAGIQEMNLAAKEQLDAEQIKLA